MMREEKKKSASFRSAAAVILACYLVQTASCFRLRKTERREWRKDADSATGVGVQEGEIVFGEVFETGLDPESHGTRKALSNASAEDETAYQADFVGWAKGQIQDASSKEAQWKHMSPSLQCSGDQMKFRSVGPGASQFAVVQGTAPALPLSQVPSTCGYTMNRNSMALIMLVPYDGCNVIREGGSYVLPLRWHGIPVSLWCPKPSASSTTSAPPQTFRYPPSNPRVPQIPRVPTVPQVPQILRVPQVLKNPEMSTPILPPSHYFLPPLLYPRYPSVLGPATVGKKSEIPKFPQYPPFSPPFYPYFHPPVTTAAPTTKPPTTTTTTTTATAAPAKITAIAPFQMFPFPPHSRPFSHFPWPFQGSLPAVSQPIAKPAAQPQLPQLPSYMPFLPQYPPFFAPQYPKNHNPDRMPTEKPNHMQSHHRLHHHPQNHHHPHYQSHFAGMPFPPPSV
ncbi:uncharacterized protein [Brachyistius frenatus]|uniref:uncharacterized protein n=1 Tax=Brachyistius frenatus TaxID=100188 RepID=UPI0037E9AEEA